MDMQMHDIVSCGHEKPEEADSSNLSRFEKSLQELRDLRSQLHYAADYCETTFLKVNEKQLVMEDTKEYICRAVVTVVDHLGSVSTNLEWQLSNNKVISEAELRIDCLKQRLLACEQYGHNVALTKVCCSPDFRRHCSRYIAPPLPNLEKSNDVPRIMSEHGIEDDLPLFLYTHAHEPPSTTVSTLGFDFSKFLPVRNLEILFISRVLKSLDTRRELGNQCKPMISYYSFDGVNEPCKAHFGMCYPFSNYPSVCFFH